MAGRGTGVAAGLGHKGQEHRTGQVGAGARRRMFGARRKVIEQHIGRAAVGDLTAGQQEAERPTFAVGERVELAVAAAPADPDRLSERPPPFPPPAQRCAFMWVLSIRTSAGGPPAAASATNSSCDTPFAAQRTNRL